MKLKPEDKEKIKEMLRRDEKITAIKWLYKRYRAEASLKRCIAEVYRIEGKYTHFEIDY
ncbi:MAG: hypothetical protein GY865_16130 [candidate division Zixibacteria bacterium]|nr:hypothetical protein [candidate division Zixibacteria bacterium]